MSDRLATLRYVSWTVHALAGLCVGLLLMRAGIVAGVCLGVGALIGCGATSAVSKRPLSLYVTFGSLMGYLFWLCIGLLRRGDLLTLIPALLLVAGASWLLREPAWPSAIFTWVALFINLALVVDGSRSRYEAADSDPEMIARAGVTAAVLLGIGVVESIAGFAETLLGGSRKKKRSTNRAIRTPIDPPML